MRFLALLIALSTFCEPAIAQAAECQSIAKASDRLACYDKAAAPASKAKPSAAATPASQSQPGQVVDMLEVENSRLDAKIKNICRGC
jgi:hypothetical protein